jgi:hypothetical protein
MIEIKNFNLQSVVVGCKHTRAFTVDNTSGLIADYILGELGIEGSPFPKGHYDKIRFGEGVVELINKEETNKITTTRDAIAIQENTSKIEGNINSTQIMNIIQRAKHIFPGILSFIKQPKAICIGILFQYTETTSKEREKYSHPAAEYLINRLTKIKLVPKEHPSDVNVKIAYRQGVVDSVLNEKIDDYNNITLSIRDTKMNDLWPIYEKEWKWDQETRIATISIDIQRIFDPRKLLTVPIIESHVNCVKQIFDNRISYILDEVGIGK